MTRVPLRSTLQGVAPYQGPGAHYDVWGYQDALTGREYAIAMYGDGIQVFDVTDPTSPRYVGRAGNRGPKDAKTWKQFVYATDELRGEIIDLSDPENPELIGDAPKGHNVFVDERGYLYAAQPTLRIYDLNDDPTNPRLVWEKDPQDSHGITVIGNRLYDFAGSATNIFDVSNPAAPELLSTIEYDVFHHSGWPTEDGDHLFITTEGEPAMLIYDISNVRNPQYVNCLHPDVGTLHDVYVVGDLAYTSAYSEGLRIFDVSNPTRPELYAEFDPYSHIGSTGAFGVYPFSASGTIYVSDDSGLFLYSID